MKYRVATVVEGTDAVLQLMKLLNNNGYTTFRMDSMPENKQPPVVDYVDPGSGTGASPRTAGVTLSEFAPRLPSVREVVASIGIARRPSKEEAGTPVERTFAGKAILDLFRKATKVYFTEADKTLVMAGYSHSYCGQVINRLLDAQIIHKVGRGTYSLTAEGRLDGYGITGVASTRAG